MLKKILEYREMFNTEPSVRCLCTADVCSALQRVIQGAINRDAEEDMQPLVEVRGNAGNTLTLIVPAIGEYPERVYRVSVVDLEVDG